LAKKEPLIKLEVRLLFADVIVVSNDNEGVEPVNEFMQQIHDELREGEISYEGGFEELEATDYYQAHQADQDDEFVLQGVREIEGLQK
jgi:hypothetical protein